MTFGDLLFFLAIGWVLTPYLDWVLDPCLSGSCT